MICSWFYARNQNKEKMTAQQGNIEMDFKNCRYCCWTIILRFFSSITCFQGPLGWANRIRRGINLIRIYCSKDTEWEKAPWKIQQPDPWFSENSILINARKALLEQREAESMNQGRLGRFISMSYSEFSPPITISRYKYPNSNCRAIHLVFFT